MKLVQIMFHFEYADAIERILDHHEVQHYVRLPMVEGRDREGKHFGTQVHPGSVTVVQAQLPDEKVDALLNGLRAFRDEKRAHQHLEAAVLPIERSL